MDQEIRFCTSADGVRLACATTGDGPPLVVVSGWLSHLQFEWDDADVRAFWEGLARGRRLVRFDKRGTGLSDWDVPDMSFEARVRDLGHVADALGLDRFDLLGISEGGATAAAYAARYPERVKSLMLYGAYPRLPFPPDTVDVFLHMVRTDWGIGSAAYTAFMVPGTPEQLAWFTELQRVSASGENAARTLAETVRVDVTPILKEITVPTLIAHRKNDSIHPFEFAREMASLIPGARLEPLEGDMYWPWWGDRKALLNTLNAFLGVEELMPASTAPPKLEHKLLAIVSTDLVGYSRLMAEDEERTIREVYQVRARAGAMIPEHHGRLVDFTGDNFLAEFSSALDAVTYAIEAQRDRAERNAQLEPGHRLEMRIGIHLGDVAVEGDRLYGDGVNIAARLEGLAESGGICVSDVVRAQVRRKVDFDFEDLGEQTVKNIPDPVRVFRTRPLPATDGT